MGKSLEKAGKTVQDAIAAALDEMRLTIDDVHIDVLDEGKPGLFGLLSGKPARVRLTELDDVPAAINATSSDGTPVGGTAANITSADGAAAAAASAIFAANATTGGEAADSVYESAASHAGNEAGSPDEERAIAYLDELLKHMHIAANISVASPADDENTSGSENNASENNAGDTPEGFALNIESEDSGILIGHRGETLDSLQYLANLYINRRRDGFLRVTVDVEDYKKKREAALRRLAERMADKVVRLRRNFTLDAMNSYERRVVHSALQNHPRVETYSIGEDPNRKVVVTLKNGRSGYTPRHR